MKTLYPIKTFTAFFCAMLIFFTASAQQQAEYAGLTKRTAVINSTAHNYTAESVIKVRGRNQNQVLLYWAPFKGAVSHYVLERSIDGRVFQEAGLLFTGDWEEEPEYFYADKFKRPYTGTLYYRLRVVGLDESEIYTPVTILSASGSN